MAWLAGLCGAGNNKSSAGKAWTWQRSTYRAWQDSKNRASRSASATCSHCACCTLAYLLNSLLLKWANKLKMKKGG
jgi:hypothetical protein